MTEPRKPHLTLVGSPITLAKLVVLLRQLTGRDPPDDIEEARQILAGRVRPARIPRLQPHPVRSLSRRAGMA
jgi:hypothetical protein